MEQILRRRHPNSLPSLMMTAAVIPEEQEKSPLVTVLEGRVRKLEQEIEERDREEDKMLRAVEQKYNNIKVRTNCKTTLPTHTQTEDMPPTLHTHTPDPLLYRVEQTNPTHTHTQRQTDR